MKNDLTVTLTHDEIMLLQWFINLASLEDFCELTQEQHKSLGSLEDKFIDYWEYPEYEYGN